MYAHPLPKVMCVSTHKHSCFFLREVGKEYAKALLLVIFGTGLGCTEAAAARAFRRLLRPELRPEPSVSDFGQRFGVRGRCCCLRRFLNKKRRRTEKQFFFFFYCLLHRMGTLLEVKVRLAGPDGRTRPTQFFADTQVACSAGAAGELACDACCSPRGRTTTLAKKFKKFGMEQTNLTIQSHLSM